MKGYGTQTVFEYVPGTSIRAPLAAFTYTLGDAGCI